MAQLPFEQPDNASGPEPASPAETLLSTSLLEAIPDAIVAVNQGGIIVQVNSQAEDLFGYSRSELIGQSVDVLVPDRHRPAHQSHRQEFRKQPLIRRMGSGLDLKGRRRDGSEFAVEISLSPVPSNSGLLVLSAIRDISDRKRVEEQLRKAHEELARRKDRQLWDYQSRLAGIVDSSCDAIIGKNLDGIVTHWNKGAENIYGYRADEMIGRSISILAPPDRPDEIPAVLERIRAGESVDYFETVRVTRDGRSVDVSVAVSPIRDSEGQIVGASAIARDITAQKRAEDRLRQAQKMEAVGRLAGGIAHDFNNILGIITACTELLRSRIASDAPYVSYLDNIREAAGRGATLTRQLLAFGRRQAMQPVLLDLNERLREMHKLLRPLLGDDVQITLRPASAATAVEADPGHLDQVVLNLAVNARDAMPRGGRLVIETDVKEVDEIFARHHAGMSPGRYVMLAISDNGAGMDAATRSRIFEPFFTTKDAGKGTGLGLATVYGIVQQMAGHIWVYSEIGRGTTFRIYLPSAERRLGVEAKSDPEALPPRREGATILLVEDDNLMRSLTQQMLEEHGYRVLAAEDGRRALECIAAEPAAIDLTLTDVMMRGMSGPEMVLRLTETHPAMKIVYMSGYTGELLAENNSFGHGLVLLEKPFSRTALLRTVHSALVV